MEEWQKILISSGFGFIAGLLGDPLRHQIALRRKRRLMRRAIYREIAQNYCLVRSSESENVERHGKGLASLLLLEVSSEVFDHYRSADAETLFELREYPALKEIYGQVGLLMNPRLNANERLAVAGLVFAKFEVETFLGRISAARLRWHIWQVRRKGEKLRKRIGLDKMQAASTASETETGGPEGPP